MQVGVFRFRVRPWAVALYLSVAAAMLALGNWQLQRADEKIGLLASAEQARAAAPVPVTSIADPVRAAAAFRRVSVDGVLQSSRQLLWDNRVHRGRAGYEIITPVRLADGRIALVNRGWVPPGPTRQALPDVNLDDRCGSMRLEGLLSRPSQGFMSGPAVQDTTAWPRTLQYFDYPAIEAALGEPVVAGIVQLQVADDGSALAADNPVTDDQVRGGRDADGRDADGRDADGGDVPPGCLAAANWQPAASGPERHYSYAFQWFAMAAGLTVLFVVVNTSSTRVRHTDGQADQWPDHQQPDTTRNDE